MSHAQRFSIPHHDPLANYAEPHECLPLEAIAHQTKVLPAMYTNLAYVFKPEESMSDYIHMFGAPTFSVIFRKRPEAFIICRN